MGHDPPQSRDLPRHGGGRQESDDETQNHLGPLSVQLRARRVAVVEEHPAFTVMWNTVPCQWRTLIGALAEKESPIWDASPPGSAYGHSRGRPSSSVNVQAQDFSPARSPGTPPLGERLIEAATLVSGISSKLGT